MRVVHIIDSGGYYGAEVMLTHLCQAQQALGLDVEVISIGTPGNYEKPLEAKLRGNGIPCIKWRMMALPDMRESFKILRYCEASSTNVIHSHGYKGNILLGLLPKRCRKIPVVTTLHGYTRSAGFSKMMLNQWLDKLCLRRLDAAVLVSEGMRHQAPSNVGAKLHVIANGIPDIVPSDAEQPIEYFENESFNIGAIGRLSHEKNFQLLIRAMPRILDSRPNTKLVIYGEGTERADLEALINQLSLTQTVFLPGYIEEPARLFRHADVFINCSITEGMPITLLEALRAGCPIVASDIAANKSLLTGINGATTLVSLSEEEFAHAILNMAALSPEEREVAKAEALQRFEERHTAKEMAQKYWAVYSSVCNTGASS